MVPVQAQCQCWGAAEDRKWALHIQRRDRCQVSTPNPLHHRDLLHYRLGLYCHQWDPRNFELESTCLHDLSQIGPLFCFLTCLLALIDCPIPMAVTIAPEFTPGQSLRVAGALGAVSRPVISAAHISLSIVMNMCKADGA